MCVGLCQFMNVFLYNIHCSAIMKSNNYLIARKECGVEIHISKRHFPGACLSLLLDLVVPYAPEITDLPMDLLTMATLADPSMQPFLKTLFACSFFCTLLTSMEGPSQIGLYGHDI